MNRVPVTQEKANFGLSRRVISGFTPRPAMEGRWRGMSPDNIIPFEQPKPHSRFAGTPMKSDLVEKASEIVTDPLVLINMVSKRVRQLNSGRSPLIPTVPSMGAADIALQEIIEGKIKLAEANGK